MWLDIFRKKKKETDSAPPNSNWESVLGDLFQDMFKDVNHGTRSSTMFSSDVAGVLDGCDVVNDVNISASEAKRGKEVEVQTLYAETLTVKIPAGIRDGQLLRITGKGLPNREGGCGDMLLRIVVENADA